MSSLASNLAVVNDRRRSQRVLLRIPVQVIGHGTDRKPFSELTYTAVVNAHGGLIYLTVKVTPGDSLILNNPETNEEQLCRVSRADPSSDGRVEVGIEFVKPAPNFWRVSFPPADWAPHSPDITADTF